MNSEFWSGALHAYYSDSVTKHHIIMVRVRIPWIPVELGPVLVGSSGVMWRFWVLDQLGPVRVDRELRVVCGEERSPARVAVTDDRGAVHAGHASPDGQAHADGPPLS